jgi:hypothetical protein
MSSKEISLHHLEIGDNFFATRAWISTGPIVLVSTQNGTAVETKARLDTQKSIFIDTLPYPVSQPNMGKLIAAVVAAQSKLRR